MSRTRTSSKPPETRADRVDGGHAKKGLTITLPPELGDALKVIAARTGHTIPEALKIFSEEVMVAGIGAAAERMIERNNAKIEELRGMHLPGMFGAAIRNLRGAVPNEDDLADPSGGAA